MAIPVIAGSTTSVATSASLTLTIPSGVSNGDLLLILVGNDNGKAGEGWIDNTTGWTQHYSYGGGDGAYIGFYSKIADGTNEDSVTINSTDADDMYGWYLHVTGQNATSPVRVVGSSQTGAASSVTISALTTDTNTYSLAFSQTAFDGADATFSESGTGWSMVTPLTQGAGGTGASGVYSTKGIPTASTTTGTSIIDFTISDGFAATQFIIAGDESTPSVDEWGACDINAPAVTVAVSSEIDRNAAMSISSLSDLTVAGSLDIFGATSLTSSSTLTCVGAIVVNGAVSLSSTSALTANGTIDSYGKLNISSSSALSVGASILRNAALTLSTTAALAASSSIDRNANLDLSSTSTLEASATVISLGAVLGHIEISSTSSLVCYDSIIYDMSDIRGDVFGAIDISSTSSLIATGSQGLFTYGQASLSSLSSLTVFGGVVRLANVDISSTSTLSVLAHTDGEVTGRVTMSSSSSLVVDASRERSASVALSSTSSLFVDSAVDIYSASNINSTSSLSIDGYRDIYSSSNISSTSSLVIDGYRDRYSDVSISSTSSLIATATNTGVVTGACDISSSSSILVDSSIDRYASITLDIPAATVVASLTKVIGAGEDKFGTADINSSSSLLVASSINRSASISLSSVSSLTVAAEISLFGSTNISSTSLIVVDGHRDLGAEASLVDTETLTVDASLDIQAEVLITSTSSLEATIFKDTDKLGQIEISSSSQLSVDSIMVYNAKIEIDGGLALLFYHETLSDYESSDATIKDYSTLPWTTVMGGWNPSATITNPNNNATITT